jgi:hypothetical protein
MPQCFGELRSNEPKPGFHGRLHASERRASSTPMRRTNCMLGTPAMPCASRFPIKSWPPLEIGVVWRAPGTPLERRVVELLAERAGELWGKG